jgi:hypothetical protein
MGNERPAVISRSKPGIYVPPALNTRAVFYAWTFAALS